MARLCRAVQAGAAERTHCAGGPCGVDLVRFAGGHGLPGVVIECDPMPCASDVRAGCLLTGAGLAVRCCGKGGKGNDTGTATATATGRDTGTTTGGQESGGRCGVDLVRFAGGHVLSGAVLFPCENEYMPITFHPKPGQVFYCDFKGYIVPEIVKARPVVVVSPSHLQRPGLVTEVPLSTTPPDPVRPYHYKLKGNPVPGSDAPETWAKCDLFASVSLERLDRVKVGRGDYKVGAVSMEQVKAIRRACLVALGVDLENPMTYT